jgi:hypothetical protein
MCSVNSRKFVESRITALFCRFAPVKSVFIRVHPWLISASVPSVPPVKLLIRVYSRPFVVKVLFASLLLCVSALAWLELDSRRNVCVEQKSLHAVGTIE